MGSVRLLLKHIKIIGQRSLICSLPKMLHSFQTLRYFTQDGCVQQKQKSKTSIVVSCSSPEDGNRAIEQGMIWEGSAHSAELYSPGCQMQQCHKCQHYGHLGNRCHAPIKCAVCAGDHQSRSCSVKKNGGEYKCALCNGAHTAYDPGCPERQKQFDAVLKAQNERPLRFVTQPHSNPTVESCKTAHVSKSPNENFNPAASISTGTNTSTTSNVSVQLNNLSTPEPASEER